MQFPAILRPLFGRALWRVRTNEKLIFLTFDDGPVPEVTAKVLDILDEKNWKATFFCVGENVVRFPELFQEIKDKGHAVGNHSFNHLKGTGVKTSVYLENVDKADDLIGSGLFRPPYGAMKLLQALKLSSIYTLVMWDLITYDFDKRQNPSGILNLVKKNLRPGSIVVFHDSLKAEANVLTSLPEVIDFWKSQGYNPGLL